MIPASFASAEPAGRDSLVPDTQPFHTSALPPLDFVGKTWVMVEQRENLEHFLPDRDYVTYGPNRTHAPQRLFFFSSFFLFPLLASSTRRESKGGIHFRKDYKCQDG